MMSLYQDDARAKAFADRELGQDFALPFIGLVVLNEHGKVIGAAILNNFIRGRNIDIAVVGRNAWTIGPVRGLARYCFERSARMTARTREDNAPAIRALISLGFEREGVMPDYFGDGVSAVVFGLLRRKQKLVKVT